MIRVKQITQPSTLLQWYLSRAKINMEPSYQRRSNLWQERNKKLLINSILNQYDMPKFYLSDFTSLKSNINEGKTPYAVIDGKQRLETIFSFFENKLRLDETLIFIKKEALDLKGYSYSDVQRDLPKLAQQFDEFVPTVMGVVSDNLEEIQELFIRLNQNVSISGPERRNAMPGPLPPIIRSLSVHHFFRENCTFPINRGQDLNVAAKLLFIELKNSFVSTKKSDLDRFVSTTAETYDINFQTLLQTVKKYLNTMSNIFSPKDDLLSSQAQIPLYYVLVKENPHPILRDFLADFEERRARVRREVRERSLGKDTRISDQEILAYNGMLRSHDDRSKQEAMFSILMRRISQYRKKK